MRKIYFVFTTIFVTINVVLLCSCQKVQNDELKDKKRELVVDSQDGIMHIGTKKDVEAGMRTLRDNSRLDPADDYVMSARRNYKKGNYKKAEQECLKALKTAKHKIVFSSAHRTLLNIYETTGEYELAIKEVDWLLEHVSVYAKPGLIEKREELQELLSQENR